MSQTARMVRPQEQGPARRGLAWEVIGILALLAALWGSLIWYAGVRVGWWAQ
jgi:hypothetical protein